MKFLRHLPVLAIILLAGCATTAPTENLLSASGFKTRTATTPAQTQLLASLPPEKVSRVSHHGHLLYVFPDAKQHVLYVGRQTEYAAYQQLRLEKKIAAENLASSEFTQEANWDSWGGTLSDGFYNF